MGRLSPGRFGAWLRARVRGARYLIGDIAYAVGNALGAAGRTIARLGRAVANGFAAFWGALSITARRRLVAALGAAAVVILFLVLAVPNLPCEFPGGDRCPPHDDAAEIVPAASLAYVHVNADPDTEQYEKVVGIADRVPLLAQQILARAVVLAPGAVGGPSDFRRRIEPWFGGEAAIALVPGPGPGAARVILLEADDSAGAATYARKLAAGSVEKQGYRGTRIAVDARGVATAQVDGFLVVGSNSGVRAIVDVATGAKGTTPLADDPTAEEVRDELPDHRFLEAWLSPAGAAKLSGGSAVAGLAPFVSPGTTRGAAVALSAGADSLQLAVRSELDPEREKASPGFFAAFPEFAPSLAEDLPEDSLAYLGIGDPARTVRALLGQAAEQAPGIAGSFADLADSLKKQDEVDLNKDLLGSLGDEAAFGIGVEKGDGAVGPGAPPFLEFVAKGVNEDRARRALAGLQKPLADAFNPGSALQAPVFDEREVDGVAVRSISVSPTIELAYAIFDGLAAVATNPAGIEQLISGDGGLDSDDAFEQATDDFEDEVRLLAFLDLKRLLAEGFEVGLAEVPAFATFSDDLRSLDALALEVHSDDDLLSTDARLLVTH